MSTMNLSDLTKPAVEQTLAEFDQLGREDFLRAYGFRPGRYKLVRGNRQYDSKAVAGVAMKFTAFGRPAKPSEFSGGEKTVAQALRQLGFDVVELHQSSATVEDADAQDVDDGQVPVRVLCVYVSSSQQGQDNHAFGIDTQTWGFPRLEDHYTDIRAGDWVLSATARVKGGPRIPEPEWLDESSLDMVIGRIQGPIYQGVAPHWPDESASNIKYPFRFGYTPLASVEDVARHPEGFWKKLSLSIRSAGISNRAVWLELTRHDLSELLDRFGLPQDVDIRLNDTAGTVSPPRQTRKGTGKRTGGFGAGRLNDPEQKAAIEQHAVERAIAQMKQLGWDDVKELGKPYDLVCRKSGNPNVEKHVEVKGTTGGPAYVEFTPNEVEHFRSCPFGADLIVVHDIVAEKNDQEWSTRDGVLRHFENFTAPAESLQATGWRCELP